MITVTLRHAHCYRPRDLVTVHCITGPERMTVVATPWSHVFTARCGWWRRNRIKRTRRVWQRYERRIA